MKTFTFLILAFFSFLFSNAQKKPLEITKNQRIEKVINSNWTFNYFPDPAADKGYELDRFDDSRWPAISLPHTWNTFETTGELNPYAGNTTENDSTYWWIGWGWYRKHFSINQQFSGKKIFIEFKGVRKYCRVWLNGKFLGEHKGGNSCFDFDVTQFIIPGKDNILAVAVSNSRKVDSGISPLTEGDFDVLGGIYNDVTLVLKEKLYIPMQGSSTHEGGTIVTSTQSTANEGIVKVMTWVKNDFPQKKSCTLQTSILDATGKAVQVLKSDAIINPGQVFKFEQTSKPVKNLQLWTEKEPARFKIYSEILDGKLVSDAYASPPGSRFTFFEDKTTLLTINQVLDGNAGTINKLATLTVKGVAAGEPAKIVLNGSQQKIAADRGSVVIVTADIVDSKGSHVPAAANIVRWKVSGPATLVGPAVYEPDIFKQQPKEGVRYKNTPVSNLIRSTGKPGKIQISASASGLATGSLDIQAEEKKPDNSVIIEPVLVDEGRKPVANIPLAAKRLEEVPEEIRKASDDFKFNPSTRPVLGRTMRDYLKKNNPSVDTASVEFKALIDLLASHLLNNSGQLSANDFNFNIDNYNNCRLISGYVNSTKLPPLFKEGLKKYYANAVVRQGSEKNAGDEMNWLNWIPSGGTVVIVQNEKAGTNLKGAVFTKKTELIEIISVVYPQFLNFSEEAKERALIFISKMNPYIHENKIAGSTQQGNRNATANISYTAETDQPVLIPALKFISE